MDLAYNTNVVQIWNFVNLYIYTRTYILNKYSTGVIVFVATYIAVCNYVLSNGLILR
jgi:hypothetical protein